jgi:hypothetical protein
MAIQSEYARSYNSFSGVDIKATFGSQAIGEIQAISYSITREKAPIYTMGSADPRAYARGKRGIAGSLIFIVFDRHALLATMRAANVNFLSDIEDIRPDAVAAGQTFGPSIGSRATGIGPSTPAGLAETNFEMTNTGVISNVGQDQEPALPWFTDQIPPFDVTLVGANEYGCIAAMKIFGVEVLNEGMGMSIDDVVCEQQMTYVARTLTPWTYMTNKLA